LFLRLLLFIVLFHPTVLEIMMMMKMLLFLSFVVQAKTTVKDFAKGLVELVPFALLYPVLGTEVGIIYFLR